MIYQKFNNKKIILNKNQKLMKKLLKIINKKILIQKKNFKTVIFNQKKVIKIRIFRFQSYKINQINFNKIKKNVF